MRVNCVCVNTLPRSVHACAAPTLACSSDDSRVCKSAFVLGVNLAHKMEGLKDSERQDEGRQGRCEGESACAVTKSIKDERGLGSSLKGPIK